METIFTMLGLFVASSLLVATTLCLRAFLLDPSSAIESLGRSPRVPWGWRSVLSILIAQILLSLLFATIFQVTSPSDKTAKPDNEALMRMLAAVNLCLIAFVPPLLLKASGGRREDLGLGFREPWRDLWRGFAAFVVTTPWIMVINLDAIRIWKAIPHPAENLLRSHPTVLAVLTTYLSAGILAPIAEELIFRGVFQRWLSRLLASDPRSLSLPRLLARRQSTEAILTTESISVEPNPISERDDVPVEFERVERSQDFLIEPRYKTASIILTSLLFAIAHAPQMPAPIPLFVFSLVLGWLFEKTDSLIGPIVLHALFNILNTSILLFAVTR